MRKDPGFPGPFLLKDQFRIVSHFEKSPYSGVGLLYAGKGETILGHLAAAQIALASSSQSSWIFAALASINRSYRGFVAVFS